MMLLSRGHQQTSFKQVEIASQQVWYCISSFLGINTFLSKIHFCSSLNPCRWQARWIEVCTIVPLIQGSSYWCWLCYKKDEKEQNRKFRKPQLGFSHFTIANIILKSLHFYLLCACSIIDTCPIVTVLCVQVCSPRRVRRLILSHYYQELWGRKGAGGSVTYSVITAVQPSFK